MQRRHFMAVAGLGVAGLGVVPTKTNAQAADDSSGHSRKHHQLMKCAKACSDCALECSSCAKHCLESLQAGKEKHSASLQSCLDCAEVCTACAALCARGSAYSAVLSKACAEICEQCAALCKTEGTDEHMQRCAKVCLDCAKICREAAQPTA